MSDYRETFRTAAGVEIRRRTAELALERPLDLLLKKLNANLSLIHI